MIKKLVVLLLMSFMITGCTKIPNTTTETSPVDNKESSKILIAYFSWADNTVVENEKASIESALKHYESIGDQNDNVDATSSASILQPGNVGKIATWIQENIGGDLFSIQVTIPYPSNYDECLDRAADEKTKNARPVLKEKVDNLNDYDTVFIGYPNWWYSVPMPVLTFIDENNLSDKNCFILLPWYRWIIKKCRRYSK